MKIVILSAIILAMALGLHGQDIKFAGTKAPDPAVLELLGKYEAASTGFATVAERDARRKPLLSDGYFYHGMDGKPIDSEGFTARQTKNDFKQTEVRRSDFVLYQYENTAILTYHQWSKGSDKGKASEGYSSFLLVMGKENGVWKVVSDIIGQEPNAPSVSKPTPPTGNFEAIKEFLLASAAADFNANGPLPSNFRKVRIGHVNEPKNDASYRLCGEFLASEKGRKPVWTPFATVKTSGYEQYIGQTMYCSDKRMIWNKTPDLSATLKSRLDPAKKEK